MLYVYMTNCSLIRAYNQMTNARRDGVNSTGTPCSVEWLDGVADEPSKQPKTTIHGTRSKAKAQRLAREWKPKKLGLVPH